MIGVDVPVLVKHNSLVFSGAVSLSGNLSFFNGNPGKVLAEIVPTFDNGAINYVHVAGGGAESIVVICTSSPISANCPSVSL